MRDFQRSKVYNWENSHVKPFDKGAIIPYDKVQMMIDAIWLQEGLQFPPKVLLKNPLNTTAWAKANRSNVWIPPEGLPRWVILHELAHSLNGQAVNEDGEQDVGDRHGPDFVGLYMKLLVKYLGIALPILMYTAQKDRVKFNIGAQVAFKK